jgi:hypothetical protein
MKTEYLSKSSIKTDWLNRSTGNLAFNYALFTTDESFQAALKEIEFPEASDFMLNSYADATCHFLRVKGVMHCLVTIHENPNDIEVVGLLAHEALHIWKKHLKIIGERKPGEEQECYGVQFITQNLYEAYKKQTQPKKKRTKK